MSGPRVFDGHQWNPVTEDSDAKPIQPVEPGDGTIFVSIASYRDGERCGATLKALFENAANPDKIVVGLVEQNEPEDKFCLEVYCQAFGAHSLKREKIRKDVTKVMTNEEGRKACPRYDQVHLVAYHHIQAKGPVLARSMVRKVLGNEEFCMQIDAHTDFAKYWDKIATEEWYRTNNEFGVVSNVPAAMDKKQSYVDGPWANEVPRQCMLRFMENGFPDYISPADGKAVDLDAPLLGHGWSAAFSFAKCHLEETVPYDLFSVYAMPVEQFSRFARMWTRGYDVYTPTKNVVFHDFEPQKNGHGNNEWFKRQKDRFRKASIDRARGLLELPGSGYTQKDLANLGIYGLGKRRSLEELESFTNISAKSKKGNVGPGLQCSGHKWVPYDQAVSPTEHLYNTPDNLEPQPEYPLRTDMIYYEQIEDADPLIADTAMARYRALPEATLVHGPDGFDVATQSNMPPVGVLFLFWVFGLIVWYLLFMTPKGGKTRSSPRSRKKAVSGAKEV